MIDRLLLVFKNSQLNSLLTLSNVLTSLGKKNPGHVNYRDSKLTHILKPSLSGNSLMAMICCISPSDNYIKETRSTLQFATRAKLVKTHATTNEVIESNADDIEKLRLDLEKARLADERLEVENRELKLAAAELSTTQSERDAAIKVISKEQSQELKLAITNLEQQLASSCTDIVGWTKKQLQENKLYFEGCFDNLKQHNERLEAQNRQLKLAVDEVIQCGEQAQTKNATVTQTLASIITGKEELATKCADDGMEQSLKAGNTNVERLNSQINELTSQTSNLATKDAALQKELDAITETDAMLEDSAKNNQEKIQQTESRVAALEVEVECTNTEKDALSNEIRVLPSAKASCKQQPT
eukprot:scaffold12086_cov66-Cyclotella_meneghiniana.AAC.3